MARDMTEKAFREAISRHGFRQSALWLTDERLRAAGGPALGYSLVLDRSGRVNRRQSLARALARRTAAARERGITLP